MLKSNDAGQGGEFCCESQLVLRVFAIFFLGFFVARFPSIYVVGSFPTPEMMVDALNKAS